MYSQTKCIQTPSTFLKLSVW